MTVERGRVRGSSAVVERGWVWGVLGGEGGSGKGDLARGDSNRDGGESRSSVLMNIQYFFMNSKSAHEI